MSGFTSNENSRLIPFNYGETIVSKSGQKQQTLSYKSLVDFLQNYYAFYPTWPYKLDEILLNSILNAYTKLTHHYYERKSSKYLLRRNYFKTLSKILSDESYICPTFKLLEYLSLKQTDLYVYAYNYRSSSNRWPESYGVVHGMELEMFFGHPLRKTPNADAKKFSPQDKNMAKDIMKRVANFVYDNNPNSNLDKEQIFWSKYELPTEMADYNEAANETVAKDSAYLAFRTLNKNNISRATNLDTCFLWNNLIPADLEVLGKYSSQEFPVHGINLFNLIFFLLS